MKRSVRAPARWSYGGSLGCQARPARHRCPPASPRSSARRSARPGREGARRWWHRQSGRAARTRTPGRRRVSPPALPGRRPTEWGRHCRSRAFRAWCRRTARRTRPRPADARAARRSPRSRSRRLGPGGACSRDSGEHQNDGGTHDGSGGLPQGTIAATNPSRSSRARAAQGGPSCRSGPERTLTGSAVAPCGWQGPTRRDTRGRGRPSGRGAKRTWGRVRMRIGSAYKDHTACSHRPVHALETSCCNPEWPQYRAHWSHRWFPHGPVSAVASTHAAVRTKPAPRAEASGAGRIPPFPRQGDPFGTTDRRPPRLEPSARPRSGRWVRDARRGRRRPG